MGDPIDLATGDLYERELDYRGAGAFPLLLERYYASGSWRMTYSRSLRREDLVLTTGGAPTFSMAWAVRDDGREVPFSLLNGAVQTPMPDITERLEIVVTAGVQTGWRLRNTDDSIELYDIDGKLLSITNRAGLVQSVTYDASGRLSSVADSHGRQLVWAYDASGHVSSVTDPAGGLIQYGHDASGRLISVTYPDGRVRTYLYNEPAHTSGASLPNSLTGILDENNHRFANFSYDTSGRAIQSEHAGGADRTTVVYNADGSRTVTDASNASRTVMLTVKNNVAKFSTVSGPPCTSCGLASSYTYDTKGNLTSRLEFGGVRTDRTYSNDGRNLETALYEASGTTVTRYTATTWHPTLRLPMQITSGYKQTNFTRDASGNVLTLSVTEQKSPFSTRTWTYTYNSTGQILTEDGPRSDLSEVTTYTYYSCATGYECGQLHTITNAVNQTTTYNTYNAHGQPLTITDANGVVTTLTYDARQRLTSRQIGTETTTFNYWPTGLLKRVTLPDGSYLEYTYDDAHRLVQIGDGEGNKITYSLDSAGNRLTENTYDPSAVLTRTRTRVFNTSNQLWKEIGAAGTAAVTTQFGYDSNNNLTSIAAPLGRTTAQLFDALGRPSQITDPGSGVTLFSYDVDDLAWVRDPKLAFTYYTYNGFGEITQLQSPDTGSTLNTYDAAGNLATSRDARLQVGTYTYDALNRVTSIAYPDLTTTLTYDAGANGKQRLTGASDANHSLSWAYDANGRVTGKSQSVGGVSSPVGYGYTNGNLTSVVTPSGQTINYGYTNGRISSVTLNGSTTILNQVLYEPFGPVGGWTWGNGTLAVRTYDLDGNVTQIDSAGLKLYSYDDAFRIVEIADEDYGSLSATYGYDSADRLTSVSLASGSPPSATISMSASSAAPGDTVTATLGGVSAAPGYWLALASDGAPNTSYVAWTAVPLNPGNFAWPITMPAFAGNYRVRLLTSDFQLLATSGTITVSAPPTPAQPTLKVSASTMGPGATITVRLTGAPGGATDWLALAQVGAANTSYLQWVYVGAGLTSRDWTVTLPSTAQSYEFRLFLDNGYTLAAASAPVIVTSGAPVGGGASQTFTYDLNGNRLTGAGATYNVSSSSNRLVSVTGALARTYSYDAAGHTTSDGINTYTYNDAGRLKTATRNGVTTTYVYNALGQRVKKSNASLTRYFVYDEAGHLLGEYGGAGALIQEIVWLNDIPVATLRPNGAGVSLHYIHTDHLNTPRRISRPSDNAIVWRWDSDAFGNTAANEDPDGDAAAFVFNLRFPGQYADAETGTNYNYFRDYDSVTGRYVESDPIGLGGGINTYAYAYGNPMNDIDPSGLDCVAVGGTVSCSVPSGPRISFPRPPGWPDYIGPGEDNYHYYDKAMGDLGKADKACLERYVRDHPTPGAPSPASPGGTGNDATPQWISILGPSPVLSYALSAGGQQVVVNVTLPGHPLFPGYVARTVDTMETSAGRMTIVNNYGEGTGWRQNPRNPMSYPINNVWYGLTQEAIKACTCSQ